MTLTQLTTTAFLQLLERYATQNTTPAPRAGKGTCPIHGPYIASVRCPTCGLHHHVTHLDGPEAHYHLDRYTP